MIAQTPEAVAPRRSGWPESAWPVQPGNYWVSVAHSLEELLPHRAAWEELSRAAVEPNPFYEPWMLLPALERFGGSTEFRFVLIYYRDHRPQEPARLCGFLPLFVEHPIGLPRPAVFATWGHDYCFLRTPLIRRGAIQETWETLWKWLATDEAAPDVLRLERTHGEGPLHQGLLDLFRERQVQFFVHETTTRALLCPRDSYESYLAEALPNKNRQEYRRQRRRMAELGDYQFHRFQPGDDLNRWIRQFLELEAAGWKGGSQTAMNCREHDRGYLETITRAAQAHGQLELLGLFLDDLPVAMKLNFLSGQGGCAFKICYDERYARLSVGVQLELDTMRVYHEQQPGRWLDSCACPDHPMVNRLWLDRRTLQTVSFCGPGPRGRLLLSWLDTRRAVRRLMGR